MQERAVIFIGVADVLLPVFVFFIRPYADLRVATVLQSEKNHNCNCSVALGTFTRSITVIKRSTRSLELEHCSTNANCTERLLAQSYVCFDLNLCYQKSDFKFPSFLCISYQYFF